MESASTDVFQFFCFKNNLQRQMIMTYLRVMQDDKPINSVILATK